MVLSFQHAHTVTISADISIMCTGAAVVQGGKSSDSSSFQCLSDPKDTEQWFS